MFAKNKHSYIYYSAVGLLLAAVYFIQSSTGLLPEIFSVRPNAALTLLVCFAMFGGEWAGMISGLCLGIATDVISAAPDGFNALFMMITGLVCALLSTYLFNRRLPAAMVLSITLPIGRSGCCPRDTTARGFTLRGTACRRRFTAGFSYFRSGR